MATELASLGRSGARTKTIARYSITGTSTIVGGDVVWDINSIAAGGYTVTVAPIDFTQYNQWKNGEFTPVVIVKCSANAVGGGDNVVLASSDGAAGSTTHYTFAADYSATPRYVVLRLSETLGADGTVLWEVA